MWDYLKLVIFGLIAILAAIATTYARDLAYLVHAILVVAIAAAGFIITLRKMGHEKAPKSGYLDAPIRIGVALTAFWGVKWNNVIANRNTGNTFAHRLNNTATFVAKHARKNPFGIITRKCERIGVAYTAG